MKPTPVISFCYKVSTLGNSKTTTKIMIIMILKASQNEIIWDLFLEMISDDLSPTDVECNTSQTI